MRIYKHPIAINIAGHPNESFTKPNTIAWTAAPIYTDQSSTPTTVDENARLVGYETDLATTKRHLIEALDEGENVILGYTQTDANNIILNGHEITVVDYKTDSKGRVTFICNDTDDNNPRPIEYSEDYLLPKIHHAALPQHIVEKDLNIVPSCLRRCAKALFVILWNILRFPSESAILRLWRVNVITAEPTSGRGQKQAGDTLRTILTS